MPAVYRLVLALALVAPLARAVRFLTEELEGQVDEELSFGEVAARDFLVEDVVQLELGSGDTPQHLKQVTAKLHRGRKSGKGGKGSKRQQKQIKKQHQQQTQLQKQQLVQGQPGVQLQGTKGQGVLPPLPQQGVKQQGVKQQGTQVMPPIPQQHSPQQKTMQQGTKQGTQVMPPLPPQRGPQQQGTKQQGTTQQGTAQQGKTQGGGEAPFVPANGAAGPSTVTVVNKITDAGSCSGGKVTLSIFDGTALGGIVVEPGASYTTPQKDWSAGMGLGVQVNAWYWAYGPTKKPRQYVGPMKGDQHQNPDNSGAQFMVSADCKLNNRAPPVFGEGVPTYLISKIEVSGSGGKCTMTLLDNQYTSATTPGCCSPMQNMGPCSLSQIPSTAKAGFKAWDF